MVHRSGDNYAMKSADIKMKYSERFVLCWQCIDVAEDATSMSRELRIILRKTDCPINLGTSKTWGFKLRDKYEIFDKCSLKEELSASHP